MPISVYPPSHRDTRAPQPEFCELCGLTVPGHELVESDVEGLRGYRICPHCHDGMRDRPSYQDRRRLNPVDYDVIGTGRVYPPGGTREFWNPSADLFSPAHIDTPALWLRNFSIPYESERWEGGLSVNGAAVLSGDYAVPDNPFATGARGVTLGVDVSGELEDAFSAADELTIALAFRTGPSLAGGINLLHEGGAGTSRLELLANGSLSVGSQTASDIVLAAGAFIVSTNYLLVVQRTAGGDVTARKNGAAAPATFSVPGAMELNLLHDPGTTYLILAEVVAYTRVLSARELACLEHYLAGFVGVEGV